MMSYIDGFVIPVKTAEKRVFIEHAQRVNNFFFEYGALRVVEGWGDDVPTGKVTDFARAVRAGDDETVVFSWIEWPDKVTRDTAMTALETNAPMMAEPMPFDGKRMIFGSFTTIVDAKSAGITGYVDGFITPVTPGNRAAYVAMAEKASAEFLALGAIRSCGTWGEDVPVGKVTDFPRSVLVEADEVVVFSWVEWSDKAARDLGWAKIMADPDMQPDAMPFDGKRMIWGGFDPVYIVEK